MNRFIAKRHGVGEREREATTFKVFSEFARIGPPLTEHVEPVNFRGTVLSLTVRDSTWLTELTFLKPEILDRINSALGRVVVEDLRLRLGNLQRKAPPSEPEPLVMTPAVRAKVEALGALVSDPEVRAAVMRAAARCLSAPPSLARMRTATAPAARGEPRRTNPAGEVRTALPGSSASPGLSAEPRDRWPKDRDRWARRGEDS